VTRRDGFTTLNPAVALLFFNKKDSSRFHFEARGVVLDAQPRRVAGGIFLCSHLRRADHRPPPKVASPVQGLECCADHGHGPSRLAHRGEARQADHTPPPTFYHCGTARASIRASIISTHQQAVRCSTSSDSYVDG
jgi:hypothetical protein